MQQILLPRYPDPDISVTVAYSPYERMATVTAEYAGEKFDPRESGNVLSLTVLGSAAASIEYAYGGDPDRPNRVEVVVK